VRHRHRPSDRRRSRGDHGRPGFAHATGPRGERGGPRHARRGRRPDRRIPRRAEDHLMAGLWVVAEPGPDGGLARISAEGAALVRQLATSGRQDAIGIVVPPDPGPAAAELATYLPVVWAVTEPAAAEHAWSAVARGTAPRSSEPTSPAA